MMPKGHRGKALIAGTRGYRKLPRKGDVVAKAWGLVEVTLAKRDGGHSREREQHLQRQ